MNYDDLVLHFGGTQAVIAARLGVKQNTVSDWKRFGIPFERQAVIQVMTDGALKADEPANQEAA